MLDEGGQCKGKRPRVTSKDKQTSIDQSFPALQIGGPSQPKKWLQPGQELSSDSSDDEENLVSFANIMDAAEHAANDFEGDKLSWNRRPRPWVLPESSETEYSSTIELSNASSCPPFEEVDESIGIGRIYTYEVIILSSDLDEDDDIDIIH